MKPLSDFWMIDNNGDALRDRADFFLGHALLARGETRRFIEFPDMLSLELPDEGPQACTPLVIIMNRGKTNQHGRIEYGAALRCKMELICPLNAVACHIFWRWQIDLEPFPDMSCRENWYDIRFINGKNDMKNMPYNTQLNRIKRAFDACGIDSTVWMHANRGSRAKLAESYGASEEQIRRLGRRNAARMEGCYLTSLPKKAMRALAGFPTKGGSYWLHRACVVPSKQLQHLVFPEVEKAEVVIAASKKPEIAAGAFLKMLKHLRVIFLQASMLLIQRYPNHCLWKHPLFSTSEYAGFRKELTAAVSTVTKPELHTLDTVVPQMAAILKENLYTLNGKIDALAAGVDSVKDLSKQRLVIRWEDVDVGQHLEVGTRDKLETPNSGAGGDKCSCPVVKLSRAVRTVVELWREYTNGVGGQMSIVEADKLMRTKWRESPTEARIYLRRKRYYDAIAAIAARESITHEAAAELLEVKRNSSGLSLNAFTKHLDDLI
ncbi:unnamed protein product [Phytophthora fragariaefolia]|uniref:Unnamed protein product n=1 Tax=Phytophthora fragariaefolia TaxID=1490495 RepID=A0A9W6WUF7_9STRA|nr:unnamed protein product [Phytophthora fragariaefolia]